MHGTPICWAATPLLTLWLRCIENALSKNSVFVKREMVHLCEWCVATWGCFRMKKWFGSLQNRYGIHEFVSSLMMCLTQGHLEPRLASDSRSSWGWPRTADPPAFTFKKLGLWHAAKTSKYSFSHGHRTPRDLEVAYLVKSSPHKHKEFYPQSTSNTLVVGIYYWWRESRFVPGACYTTSSVDEPQTSERPCLKNQVDTSWGTPEAVFLPSHVVHNST